MLSQLYIKNYALIEDLHADFDLGLTTITGETGAGKSILLGGLSLVLGKRIDLSNIKDPTKKSIIECVFKLDIYNLKPFFKTHDLEYESETIIRREVLPSGKSRAFINDSPVRLSVLEALGLCLVDIHSQHQTISLTSDAFQFQIIDALAKTIPLVEQYEALLTNQKVFEKELKTLEFQKQQSKNEFDYHSFLIQEIEDSKVLDVDLELLESSYDTLSNVEQIQSELETSKQIIDSEQYGLNSHLLSLKQHFQKLRQISSVYSPTFERLQSLGIELDDIYSEIETAIDQLQPDPERLDGISNKLKTVRDFFDKHSVNSIESLNEVYSILKQKTALLSNCEQRLTNLNDLLSKNLEKINNISSEISEKRKGILPKLVSKMESLLFDLGMPHAKFKIEIKPSEIFLSNGKDKLSFLLKANKGGQFLSLKKGASGGELSRIMLAVKFIISKHKQLPTIIFDEIDTGVSGEISNKMAAIMQEMSRHMQVFTITHLPQIAAKGTQHLKVFKTEKDSTTTTQLKLLTAEERLDEIAQMLGGKQITASAKAHAHQLLN